MDNTDREYYEQGQEDTCHTGSNTVPYREITPALGKAIQWLLRKKYDDIRLNRLMEKNESRFLSVSTDCPTPFDMNANRHQNHQPQMNNYTMNNNINGKTPNAR